MHSSPGRPPGVTVNKYMRKPTHGFNRIIAALKHTNFIRRARRTEPDNPQPQIQHGGERHGGEIVAVGGHYETNLTVTMRLILLCLFRYPLGNRVQIESTMLDQVGVDNRVDQKCVDAVVEVAVDIIVGPSRSIFQVERIITPSAASFG